MKCLKCNTEIEKDDNFCPNCGQWTPKGYIFFNSNKDNPNIINGTVIKQDYKLRILLLLCFFCIAILFIAFTIQGLNMLRPYVLLKQKILSIHNGYYSSLIKTDNQYNQMKISNQDDAYSIIIKDLESQNWQCRVDRDIYFLERELMEKYNILTVNFCDMEYDEVGKIKQVIDKIYDEFPNIKGYLTNITISNAVVSSEYIAYFQPIYQFVNSSMDINNYNKVNKTQILLNSYYFLNSNILNKNVQEIVGENWYVKDATWESLIAHEFGHYITFSALLRYNNIDNILLVTSDNEEQINKIIEIFDNGQFSSEIIEKSLYNYNNKYNKNLDVNQFSINISEYANSKDEDGNVIFDETIAEAVHDFYLHGTDSTKESLEIVNVLKEYLQ